MKKSVIVLIGIIYAASIVLVTFFGLKYATYEPEEIPVDEIKIITTDANNEIQTDDAGAKYVILYAKATFQIEYELSPSNASNKKVDFVIDSDVATIDENGLVTFTEEGSAKIYVVSTDGTRKSDFIEIYYLG